jgi:hypothetical protein
VFRHDGRIVYYRFDHQRAGQAVDPLNDLNAMHEVESSLDEAQMANLAIALATIQMNAGDLWAFHATAAQHAEAFLRTIGKWKE